MGHACGQGANGLHFLSLCQGFLGFLALVDLLLQLVIDLLQGSGAQRHLIFQTIPVLGQVLPGRPFQSPQDVADGIHPEEGGSRGRPRGAGLGTGIRTGIGAVAGGQYPAVAVGEREPCPVVLDECLSARLELIAVDRSAFRCPLRHRPHRRR